MTLIKLKCSGCGGGLIINDRHLDEEEEEVTCPYCEEPIEIPAVD
jgi:DNA-directed RNA polymerase subunit RPC12/RpoP